jgi:hypothetical protein
VSDHQDAENARKSNFGLRLAFIFRDLRIVNKYIMEAINENMQDERKIVKI